MRYTIFTIVFVVSILQVHAQGCGTGACEYEYNLTSESPNVQNVTGNVRRLRIYQSSPVSTANTIIINTTDSVMLFIEELNMNTASSAINIRDARVYLSFYGLNKIASSNDCGIKLEDASITITSTRTAAAGDSLKVSSGMSSAGIGTKLGGTVRDITILQGIVSVQGGRDGAGIGTGEAYGIAANVIESINIKGGTVIAKGGPHGAGIGTGSIYGDPLSSMDSYPQSIVKKINISGGIVHAQGSTGGAAIGTGNASVCCTGARVDNKIGTINITGGEVHAPGDNDAAGIGTGYATSYASGGSINIAVDTINISGGYVQAQGVRNSASIGTGSSSNASTSNSVDYINITGGVIDALSTEPRFVSIGRGNNGHVKTIRISGGNVKAFNIVGDSASHPKNSIGQQVYLSQLSNQPNIIDMMLNGIPYNVGGNLPTDATIYLYLPHASSAQDVHSVQWRRTGADNLPHIFLSNATWNAAISTFVFDAVPSTPSTGTQINVTSMDNFTMQYGSDAMRISVTTRFDNSVQSVLVSAVQNEVVIKIDGNIVRRISLPTDVTPDEDVTAVTNALVFSSPYVSVFNFYVGEHTFVVEYGGTNVYMPSRVEKRLTITKAVLPPPNPLPGLTTVYGTMLRDVNLPVGYQWENPDSCLVGPVGMQSHLTYYWMNGDTINYTRTQVQQVIRVNRAAANCSDVAMAMNGKAIQYGSYLRDFACLLSDGWSWAEPTQRMTALGERTVYVQADTAKYLTATPCPVTLAVLAEAACSDASTAAVWERSAQRLEVRPNPIFSGKRLIIGIPDGEKTQTLHVYSMQGALVRQYDLWNYYQDGTQTELTLDVLPGVYILKAGRAAAMIVVL